MEPLRQDQHDLRTGSVPAGQALSERIVYRLGAEVLRLDVDQLFSCCYCIQIEPADLHDGFEQGHQGRTAGHADRHLSSGDRHHLPDRNGVGRRARGERERLSAGIEPPLLEEPGQFPGYRAGMKGLHIVIGLILLPGQDPLGVLSPVLAVVPAVGAEVQAAHEGAGPVDDDQLLMMARIECMPAVEPEMDPVACREIENELVEPFLVEADDSAEIPHENEDLELGVPLAQFVQKGGHHDLARGIAQIAAPQKRHPPFELPARYQEVSPGPAGHFVKGPEIVPSVDEEAGPVLVVDAAAVPAG